MQQVMKAMAGAGNPVVGAGTETDLRLSRHADVVVGALGLVGAWSVPSPTARLTAPWS
ncbi:hypothetical protein M2160_000394 [Streptomyces sp. SAI-117]|uniref:hypothetical protein n=1 Tax=Streptomyces sp. SAI-117 TaxID=2940546 RepID=UPI00247641E1|nr:hypothetical protein [Streptomyces sp. SAI-117]MDH6565373.1 hypothetical protein [Streptomyces sp. SAI-117]